MSSANCLISVVVKFPGSRSLLLTSLSVQLVVNIHRCMSSVLLHCLLGDRKVQSFAWRPGLLGPNLKKNRRMVIEQGPKVVFVVLGNIIAKMSIKSCAAGTLQLIIQGDGCLHVYLLRFRRLQ